MAKDDENTWNSTEYLRLTKTVKLILSFQNSPEVRVVSWHQNYSIVFVWVCLYLSLFLCSVCLLHWSLSCTRGRVVESDPDSRCDVRCLTGTRHVTRGCPSELSPCCLLWTHQNHMLVIVGMTQLVRNQRYSPRLTKCTCPQSDEKISISSLPG